LLQIAIAGKRFVSRGFIVIDQMTRIVAKIKGLADCPRRIKHPVWARWLCSPRIGNLYLQIRRIPAEWPLRARITRHRIPKPQMKNARRTGRASCVVRNEHQPTFT
jgi:hypothetical protein